MAEKKRGADGRQLGTAVSGLIRSLWMTGRAERRYLERVAQKIRHDQANRAASRRSHDRARRQQLHEIRIDLSRIRCCMPP